MKNITAQEDIIASSYNSIHASHVPINVLKEVLERGNEVNQGRFKAMLTKAGLFSNFTSFKNVFLAQRFNIVREESLTKTRIYHRKLATSG